MMYINLLDTLNMYVRPLKKFLQPSQVETFFKIDGIIKLAKTLKAKMGSWGSTKTEKSPSLHVCHFKIFLKRRMTSPFSSASCYDLKEAYKHT